MGNLSIWWKESTFSRGWRSKFVELSENISIRYSGNSEVYSELLDNLEKYFFVTGSSSYKWLYKHCHNNELSPNNHSTNKKGNK